MSTCCRADLGACLGRAVIVAMAGLFAYIAGSPFVFIELYVVLPEQYGWLFGLNAAGLIAASQLNRGLLVAWRAETVLVWATAAVAGLSLVLFLVAVTGWAREEDRERTRQVGFDTHLSKPVTPEALAEIFRGLD